MTNDKVLFKDRKALFDHLGESMAGAEVQPRGKGGYATTGNMLKTFLLEHDWPAERPKDEVAHIQSLFATPRRKALFNSTLPPVHSTAEEGFFHVRLAARHGPHVDLWLDTTADPQRRFWVGYSVSESSVLDEELDRIVFQKPSLDRVWLWPEFLAEVQSKGDFRGVGVDYDYRPFERTGGTVSPLDYFKVQLWGGTDTKEIFDWIQENPKFKERVVLASVRMDYATAGSGDRFVHENIRYTGRFTTHGTDFGAHQHLVKQVREQYARVIRKVEERHRPGVDPKSFGEARSTGTPIFLNLEQRPISDMDTFCGTVFSGAKPFRLFGTPQAVVGDPHCRIVHAVDLHTGSRLFFEVYPDIIAIYLYAGACGNTIARFFTHMQHAYSRNISVERNDGSPGL